MTIRGRLLLTIVATVGALLTALGLAAPSGAAPYTTQPTISVSTQNPDVGATLTVSGSGFAAGETVDLTLHSAVYSLGSVTTDGSGAFSTQVTLPSGVSGDHTIVGTGRTSGASASAAITIGGYASSGSGTAIGSGAGSGSSGDLAYTGAAVFGIGGLGVALLVAGAVLLTAGRRRKASV